MKLLLGGKKWAKSFRMPYRFVVLGFLQRWRQPHLQLLPVPTWSADHEDAIMASQFPALGTLSSPLWMPVFLLRIQQSLIGSLGRFWVNYIMSNHSLVPGVGDTLVSKAETPASENLCLFGTLFPKEYFPEPSSLGKLCGTYFETLQSWLLWEYLSTHLLK